MRTTRAPRESQPGRVGAGHRGRQARGAATRDARSILANFISPPHIPGGGSGGCSDGGAGGGRWWWWWIVVVVVVAVAAAHIVHST